MIKHHDRGQWVSLPTWIRYQLQFCLTEEESIWFISAFQCQACHQPTSHDYWWSKTPQNWSGLLLTEWILQFSKSYLAKACLLLSFDLFLLQWLFLYLAWVFGKHLDFAHKLRQPLNKHRIYSLKVFLVLLELWGSWTEVLINEYGGDCWMEFKNFFNVLPAFTFEMVKCCS